MTDLYDGYYVENVSLTFFIIRSIIYGVQFFGARDVFAL